MSLKKIIENLHSFDEEVLKNWPEPKYYPGQTVMGIVPFSDGQGKRSVIKIHIVHVFPSIYPQWLIVYKVYGRHKQWWHEFMCDSDQMDFYIERKKQYDERTLSI